MALLRSGQRLRRGVVRTRSVPTCTRPVGRRGSSLVEAQALVTWLSVSRRPFSVALQRRKKGGLRSLGRRNSLQTRRLDNEQSLGCASSCAFVTPINVTVS